MKKNINIILISFFLSFLVLTFATALACDCGYEDDNGQDNNGSDDGCEDDNGNMPIFIGSASFRDKTVHVLDHTNSPEEGNWIILNPQNDDRVIKVPKPLKFRYSGPKSIEYGQASAALNKNDNQPYIVQYPSSAAYQYWPVYLPGENVKMSFFGQSALKEQPVEIYLLNANTQPARKLLDAYRAKQTQNLSKLFHDSMDGNYQKYQANLDRKGNLDYDLGPLDAGQYGILMLKHEEDGCITIVSGTGFIVSEYELSISSPKAIKEGEDLDITLGLKNAPQGLDCTYAALLIKDDAYRVDVNLDSDGTKNGTYLKVNDLDPFEVIGINPKEIDINPQELNASSINDPKYSEYRAKIREKANREEVQKALLKFIGEGKGSIAMGQNGQKDLSLTAFDLPKGEYYLCVAAYSPGIGIAGIAQSEIKIKSKQQYEEDEEDEEDDEPDYDGDDDEYDEDDDENDEDDEDEDQIDDGDENGDEKDDNGTGEKDGKKNHSKKKKVEPKEPKENVKAKEQCKKFVAKGAHVKFEFPKDSTCVEYVEFDSKKSTGATTATIEGLKAKSVFASINPQGEIYNNFNIRIGKGEFTNPNNLKNGAVGFRVSKAWISENNIDIDSIALQHYINKKWKLLPVEETIKDNDYVHFKAKTSSFSPFAISAEKKEITIEKEKQDQDSPAEGEGCNTKTDVQKDVPSEPKSSNNTLLKAAAFFAGLAIILVIGAVIMKKKENERKGPGQ